MRPRSHLCRTRGCYVQVSYQFLMCQSHWRMVPNNLQKAVYQEWRNCQRTGELTREYAQVVREAVAAVEQLEGEALR